MNQRKHISHCRLTLLPDAMVSKQEHIGHCKYKLPTLTTNIMMRKIIYQVRNIRV